MLPTLTRTQYQNAQISCTARGIPKPTITWKRKGSRQFFRGRIQTPGRNTRNDQVINTLTISNRVQTRHAGVYICTATNTVNKKTRTVARETRLVVQVPAQITNLLPTLTRTQYQSAQISCTAQGIPKPTIYWMRKGSLQLFRERTQTPGRNTRNDQVVSTLTISNRVLTSDAGVYICTATNRVNKQARTTSRETRLIVQVPTQVISQPRTVTVIENQRVLIPCTARGIPRPTITWMRKDGQSLRKGFTSGSTGNGEHITGMITISQVQKEDAGVYICIATNRLKRTVIEILLSFKALPGKPSSPEITSTSTNDARIKWKTQNPGNGTLISHIITYKANNSQQHQLVLNVTRYESAKTFSALLRGLRPFTPYEVWVQAKSTIGVGPSSASAHFTTYMKGSIHTQPESLDETLDKPAAVTCLVSGYPLPTIQWRKDGISVTNTNDGRIKISDIKINVTMQLSVLNITTVTRADTGTYSCEASNVLGELKRESELLVLEKPDKLVVNATQLRDSVKLTWLVTFDGNSPVTKFSVKHFDPQGLNSSHTLPGEENKIIINNTKLGARHVFIVAAVNAIGESDPVTIAFTTLAPGALATDAFPVAAVTSSMVIFVLVAVVLIVLLLWRVRKKQQSTKEEEKVSHISLELVAEPEKEQDVRAEITQPANAMDLNELKAYYTRMKAESLFSVQYRSIQTPGSPTRNVAGLPCNKVKNRYINIGAYDHSRVILSLVPQVEGSDYINANYIDGYNYPNRYIAAMGPKSETVDDFWKMVWEQRASVIVMLTQTMEKCKVKCHQYWPNKGAAMHGDIVVELMSVQKTLNFEIRKLQLSMYSEPSEEARMVLHYYFTAWPDHDVPDNATGILDLRRQVNAATLSQDTGPIIVHCSAGVGRTGAYIAIDAILNRIKKEGKMDVPGYITYMRGQRGDMVQTESQYIFIHTAILEAVAFGDSEISVEDLRVAVRKFNEKDRSNGKTPLQEQFELLDGVFLEDTNLNQAASGEKDRSKEVPTDVVPYAFNRVFLSNTDPDKGSAYINASFIGGYQSKRGFIATDAPLPDTINDFWRMVWERNVRTIVMISKLNEKYKGSAINRYWPEDDTDVYGSFKITAQKKTTKGPFIEREFEMKDHKTGDVRKVHHFHFFRWPLLSHPADCTMVLDLILDVQTAQQQTGLRPIVVHCSDGAGRTGAFCCLYITLEKLKAEGVVDIFTTARTLRTQRPKMISTLDQYRFCYDAVIAYLDSFDQYSNFEVKLPKKKK